MRKQQSANRYQSENSLVELVHRPVIITDLLYRCSSRLSCPCENQSLINELSVLIYADRERILDVLDNLLSNAKYSYGATIVINTSLAEDR
ncbi:hypothetical protein CS542_01680 [Pedobacter sp. IW39]|nr:hypothetical protein CS542_01680 [Pedobacter sp. IW39]